MSTLSSSLSASVSALLNDFIVPACKTPPSDSKQLMLSRWLTVLFGALQIGIGIAASLLRQNVVNSALTIAGFSAGLLLGVFLLGMLMRGISQFAVLAGATAGLVTLIGVAFVYTDDAGSSLVAWPWLALIGSTVTFVVGALLGRVHAIMRTASAWHR